MAGRLLYALTDFSGSRRGKWLVLALWFVATAAVATLAPQLSAMTTNDDTTFLPAGAESTRVVELVEARFPRNGTPAIIVLRNPAGLSEADYADARAISEWLESGAAGGNVEAVISVFTVPRAEDRLVSPDGTTMTIIASISGETAEDPYIATIDRIREHVAAYNGGALQVRVTGPGGLIADLLQVFEQIDTFLLIVTATLVLVLLILIYRSPVVAFVPLLSVGWVFSLASGIGALLAQNAGLPVNGQAVGIMTVVLFGAGTDYCLFISSRYREELTQTEDVHRAMSRAMRGVGEAILSAAGTILIATLLLLLATLRSNQTLGPILAVAVGVMLLAALTLVPAILTILGRFSFWPFTPRYSPSEPARARAAIHFGVWTRIAEIVSARPGAVLAATVTLFVILSAGVLGLDPEYDNLSSLPEGTESREGFELLRQGFPPGELAPTEAYVILPAGGSAYDPATLRAIDVVTQALAGQPGVSSVTSPSRPLGAGAPIGPEAVLAALEAVPPPVREAIASADESAGGPALGSSAPEAEAIGLFAASRAFLSPDEGVARIEIVLADNPYGVEALERIPKLRETARAAAAAAGLGRDAVLIGGPTATNYDTKVANDRDVRVVLPAILLAIGVVLALLLRSLVAPLYLMATIVVSYFATLGLANIIFEQVFGHDGVGSSVPFFLFVFLVALGVDYNIYLMARVREEAARLGLREGTTLALGRTGGVITSAGIILAGTFAALMTLPLRDLFQLGFAVAIGVLIDTFIVRALTVPSIVLLLGRWNWWPARELGAGVKAPAPAPGDD